MTDRGKYVSRDSVNLVLGASVRSWATDARGGQARLPASILRRSARAAAELSVVGRTLTGMGGSGAGAEWTDLARNAPAIGVSYEAARRRQADGVGTDRSWRVGADGEVRVAELLGELTRTQWYRWRGRAPSWRVLHSVPLLDARGRGRGDIDHVLIGPPGVVTVNTKHHRAGRLELDGDALVVNGRPTEYVRKARLEALRAGELLRAALVGIGATELAERLVVRPLLAIVGGRLLVTSWPAGVTMVMTRQLVPILRGMLAVLDARDVEAVFARARRSTTWVSPTAG